MLRYSHYKPPPNEDATENHRGLMTAAMVRLLNELDTQVAALSESPPAVSVYTTSNQSISSAAWNNITFTAKTYDTHNMWGSGTNVVVPAGWGGIWHVSAGIRFNAGGGTRRLTGVAVNGTSAVLSEGSPLAGFSNVPAPSYTAARDLQLAPGDILTLQAYQDSGAALTVRGSSLEVYLTMHWVRP